MADYIIQNGDNLSKIAAAHGTSVRELLELNPDYKKHPNCIHTGKTLKLPEQPKEDIDMDVKGLTVEHQEDEGSDFLANALIFGVPAATGKEVGKTIYPYAKKAAGKVIDTAKKELQDGVDTGAKAYKTVKDSAAKVKNVVNNVRRKVTNKAVSTGKRVLTKGKKLVKSAGKKYVKTSAKVVVTVAGFYKSAAKNFIGFFTGD